MPFRAAGFLDPKELLIAEAIQARAWEVLSHERAIADMCEAAAKARLSAIVLHLMINRDRSIGDLSVTAVQSFKEQ